ncbi:MAG: hypothetical protein FJY98_03385 [Candidatus Liptonbacteria bacterium]|nr:hypothetical protein [Candidatus Liptonbacteria bacterium]
MLSSVGLTPFFPGCLRSLDAQIAYPTPLFSSTSLGYTVRMQPRVVIIGAGKIGSALDSTLREKNLHAELWDAFPDKAPQQKTLKEILPQADFLFFCVPSWALQISIDHAAPHIQKNTIIVTLAKGLLPEIQDTTYVFLQKQFPDNAIAFLGGPMLADEITQGKGGVVVAAAADKKAREALQELWSGTSLRTECSADPQSVALAGVLKNIYSLGLGIANGLGWDNNKKGWFISAAVQEMVSILEEMGNSKAVAYSIAGLGDLAATGYSPHSMNYKVGNELVKTGKCELKSEGLISLPILTEILGEKTASYPILEALKHVTMEHHDAAEAFDIRFTRCAS